MRIGIVTVAILTTGLGLWLPALAAAEDAPYASYRFEKALGVVTITTGYLDRTDDLAARRATMERDGVILLETDEPRTFTRTEVLASHRPPLRSRRPSDTGKAGDRPGPIFEL